MMKELLNDDFKDPSGPTRKLTRDESSAIVNVVAGAGNETTNRLIGWMGKTLSEHPDQRRQIVENPKLIPQAIEELLRFEPPGPFMARYVTNDIERSEEHTSELQSLMRTSYAVFCLKKKKPYKMNVEENPNNSK